MSLQQEQQPVKQTQNTFSQDQYQLQSDGTFVIRNYNQAKSFCNFFPGIAGVWGIPMWVFYVNRGQCISSFGLESKDKAILEFLPANKAYRQTALQGYRTFIKVNQGEGDVYWEPFQDHLRGTSFKKDLEMRITTYDLTLVEVNHDLGLTVKVNYFTLPNEPNAGLVRKLTIENHSGQECDLEVIDGLPMIVPYGTGDWVLKNMSRTVEAWNTVDNLEKKAPYYHLNVDISDVSEVKHIKEGHFYFAFDPDNPGVLLDPIVDSTTVFGSFDDFIAPESFLKDGFVYPNKQATLNKTPSALTYQKSKLAAGAKKDIVSVVGFVRTVEQLNKLVKAYSNRDFVEQKQQQNKQGIDEVCNHALTVCESDEFSLYSEATFLDNTLRGGLPYSLETKAGKDVFNVFSRKHGDLERDYNYFRLSPTFFSQGNGNYRDVNQNRRNDIWFNPDVQDNQLFNFLNLSQADGYNPLVVKGAELTVTDEKAAEKILKDSVHADGIDAVSGFLKKSFQPGELLDFIEANEIKLKIEPRKFFEQILEVGEMHESSEHGEGFWSDHWTYNLDLVQSYLALFPERLENLLLKRKDFSFYHNECYVLPREQKYVLTANGVRQYNSVKHLPPSSDGQPRLKTKKGEGAVYLTTLIEKLVCLIANKVSTLDPSGIGIEMEADKPNWYDALNGLPGLIGSSISETVELKRVATFVLEGLKSLAVDDKKEIDLFDELASFLEGLTHLLSLEKDTFAYWDKSNGIKEHYRHEVRSGIGGEIKQVSVGEIKHFLELVIQKTSKSLELAKNKDGFLPTYFYHEVTDYKALDKKNGEGLPFVKAKAFKRVDLPLYLEGYVHALRAADDQSQAKELYDQVYRSDLYDKKLKMYKVNADLTEQSAEIGRCWAFPRGWLENESIWLHMEYKFLLELIRNELYEEFYDNYKNILVPFLDPKTYGRSILENSSFIVSSAHEDESLHGQGFVARLSGSTAELIHIWLYMNMGKKPFALSAEGQLQLSLEPALPEWLFTKEERTIAYNGMGREQEMVMIPKDSYAFNFLGTTLVVYHNPNRKNTFGDQSAQIQSIELTYFDKKDVVKISSGVIAEPYSKDVRDRKIKRIDVVFS